MILIFFTALLISITALSACEKSFLPHGLTIRKPCICAPIRYHDGETTPRIDHAGEASSEASPGVPPFLSRVSFGSVTATTPEAFHTPRERNTPPMGILTNNGDSPHVCQNPVLAVELDALIRREETIADICEYLKIDSVSDLSFITEPLFFALVDIQCAIIEYSELLENDVTGVFNTEYLSQLMKKQMDALVRLESALSATC